MKVCPKCGYERSSKDPSYIPDTVCPNCEAVYEKATTKKERLLVEEEDQLQETAGRLVCPKCGYERTSKDPSYTPRTVCPNCEAVYDKMAMKREQLRREKEEQLRQAEAESKRLVSCEVCGNSVSKNAHSCPHCGEPRMLEEVKIGKKDEQLHQSKIRTPEADKKGIKGGLNNYFMSWHQAEFLNLDQTTKTLATLSSVFAGLSIFIFAHIFGLTAITLGAIAASRGCKQGLVSMCIGLITFLLWAIVFFIPSLYK